MAPAIREDGIQFRIHPNDHNPPHVHVIVDNEEYRIRLDTDEFMGEVPPKPRKIMDAYWKHRDELVAQWKAYERERGEQT